jgi:uncharacterized membrane protein
MHKAASLPDWCVKSNQPAYGRRLKRNLNWHHPMIALLVRISPLIYIIVALIVMKRATIHIGLSEAWFARRRQAILVAWGLILASIALFVAGAAFIDRAPEAGWLFLLAIGLFFGGAIYGLVAARMVRPTRITDTHVWLKGVHPDFLAGLPELPPSAA